MCMKSLLGGNIEQSDKNVPDCQTFYGISFRLHWSEVKHMRLISEENRDYGVVWFPF